MSKFNASIYKHPTSKYIYLDLYFNGERKRPSTKLEKNTKNYKMVEEVILPKIKMSMSDGSFSFEGKIKSEVLKDFAEEYFLKHKSKVKNHTYDGDYSTYTAHIKPMFGNRSLKSISVSDLEKWQVSLLEKKLKPASIIRYRNVFYAILEYAKLNDILEKNNFEKVSSPSSYGETKYKKLEDKEDSDTIFPLNKSEIEILLEKADGYSYYFFYIMIFTGMRSGEIIALKWSDIDFEKNRIGVDKTIIKGKAGTVKTPSSVRYVDILPNLKEKLLEWKKIAPSKEYVFVNHSKKMFHSASQLNRKFKKILEENNVKVRYLYQLRHTFASTFISKLGQGVDILWVSKTLGHKNIDITLKTYAKFIKENDDEERTSKLNRMAQIWHS